MANPLKFLTEVTGTKGVVVSGGSLKVNDNINTSVYTLTASADITGSGGATFGGQLLVGQSATVNGATVLKSGLTVSGSTVTSGSLSVGGNGNLTVTAGNTQVQALTASVGNISGELVVGGNLTVNGTTTTIDTQNLLVEDAVIQLGSGSAGNADGDRGLIFNLASGNKALFWDQSDSKFKITATTTDGTTNTIVAGAAQTLEVGNLSASNGVFTGDVSVDSDSVYKIGGRTAIAVQEQLLNLMGMDIPLTGTALRTGDNTAYVSVTTGSTSGGEAGGGYVDISGSFGIKIQSGGGQHGIVLNGSTEIQGNSFSVASSQTTIQGTFEVSGTNTNSSFQGPVYVSSSVAGDYNIIDGAVDNTAGYDRVHVTNALAALDTELYAVSGALANAGVSAASIETAYRKLRTFGVAFATSSATTPYRAEFVLSGATDTLVYESVHSASVTMKGIPFLSSSNSEQLIDSLQSLSFDVAVRNPGSNGAWTNDLVSVTVTASYDGSSLYYPKFIVDAPGASDSSKVRLIVVQENPERFDIV